MKEFLSAVSSVHFQRSGFQHNITVHEVLAQTSKANTKESDLCARSIKLSFLPFSEALDFIVHDQSLEVIFMQIMFQHGEGQATLVVRGCRLFHVQVGAGDCGHGSGLVPVDLDVLSQSKKSFIFWAGYSIEADASKDLLHASVLEIQRVLALSDCHPDPTKPELPATASDMRLFH
jgi:hypothetical protein